MRTHRATLHVWLTLSCVAAPASASADDAPAPSVSRIDYAHPEKYLVIHPSFGDVEKIRRIGESLRSGTAENRIAAIGRWIDGNVGFDPKAADVCRNFDAIVNSAGYGGCADHSILFAALARACGIPTITVKTMDAGWIRRFRTTGETRNWSGHVFLEVFVDGRWRLLNATEMELHDDYDPAMRILPGDRYAYDKGSDPFELVLSSDWERWKAQTVAYFSGFDLAKLPAGAGRELGADDDIYIAADSPVYQAVTERVRALGYRPRVSFNADFEEYLARSKGKILVATCVGDRVLPPAEAYGPYLPLGRGEIRMRVHAGEPGISRKRLDDGTRVVLIYARDVAGLLELIRTMEIRPES